MVNLVERGSSLGYLRGSKLGQSEGYRKGLRRNLGDASKKRARDLTLAVLRVNQECRMPMRYLRIIQHSPQTLGMGDIRKKLTSCAFSSRKAQPVLRKRLGYKTKMEDRRSRRYGLGVLKGQRERREE